MPLISIVTACRNSDRFVREHIESISRQTGYQLVEHIIIDGASTDKTVDIIKEYDSIILLSNSDSGQSEAMNKGIKLAKGKWILIFDSDDLMMEGMLSKYLEAALVEQSADLIYGHTLLIDENSKYLKLVYSVPFSYSAVQRSVTMPPSCGLMVRANFMTANLFDETFHYNMDTEWYLRCCKESRSRVLNYFTVGFRFWSGNKTSSLYFNNTVNESHMAERRILNAQYGNQDNRGYKKVQFFVILIKVRFQKLFYLLSNLRAFRTWCLKSNQSVYPIRND